MPSKLNTGGLKEIGYAKPSKDPEFDERIDTAFENAQKRKKRNRIIGFLIFIAILLGTGIYFWLK